MEGSNLIRSPFDSSIVPSKRIDFEFSFPMASQQILPQTITSSCKNRKMKSNCIFMHSDRIQSKNRERKIQMFSFVFQTRAINYYSCAFGLQQYYFSPCATLQVKIAKVLACITIICYFSQDVEVLVGHWKQ